MTSDENTNVPRSRPAWLSVGLLSLIVMVLNTGFLFWAGWMAGGRR
ncbi:hypothetical protein Achl_4026 (plasmid) [Pseudarthrobacter chlorophenolicus A6]|uniref:Uncharacterized protein n=1 Tax=Pseudarthrobacter chlorophenolicus (strain ATCC 700700 / DSM 12829 / CIP 107037 / JCM 12360 / KCTC 9906 / NCIMB 13794 / A6) TaxID=452863 RepID=B8HHT0_PSECP|nr:hypothetical protein Achl_4026 [Pseudarthrobacter chlorophenolicus A6]SDQ19753.1 hypothetical protein SAMN04489738_0677 [Pseudarthrobacter chlorophenolicus]